MIELTTTGLYLVISMILIIMFVFRESLVFVAIGAAIIGYLYYNRAPIRGATEVTNCGTEIPDPDRVVLIPVDGAIVSEQYIAGTYERVISGHFMRNNTLYSPANGIIDDYCRVGQKHNIKIKTIDGTISMTIISSSLKLNVDVGSAVSVSQNIGKLSNYDLLTMRVPTGETIKICPCLTKSCYVYGGKTINSFYNGK